MISLHARQRMRERGITELMVAGALAKRVYKPDHEVTYCYDPSTRVFLCIRNGILVTVYRITTSHAKQLFAKLRPER